MLTNEDKEWLSEQFQQFAADNVQTALNALREEVSALRKEVHTLRKRLDHIQHEQGLSAALTIERAARELSIGRRTLEKLMKLGAIRWCLVGKRRMIPASEIRRITSEIHWPPQPRRSGRRPKTPAYDPDVEIAKARALRF